MRLNDWKAQAMEYRDVDREAQEKAEAELAKAAPVYLAMRKVGRCANGAERGKGVVYHAVEGGWRALCGTQPGRHSAGWQAEPEPIEKVSCPRCLKKLALMSSASTTNSRPSGCGISQRSAAGADQGGK